LLPGKGIFARQITHDAGTLMPYLGTHETHMLKFANQGKK
jgi:hypothetical protein